MLSKSNALPWLMALTGLVLVAREAVFYTGFAILGSAINWPASLGLPAEEIFALLRDQGDAMFTGYYFYMISSAMFIPVAVCLRWLVAGEDQLTTLLADINETGSSDPENGAWNSPPAVSRSGAWSYRCAATCLRWSCL